MTDYMKIGELAKKTHVPIDTIRYYEKLGLIDSHGRSAGGYRRFDEHCRQRLVFIKRCQTLGFSLQEIGDMLKLANEGHLESDMRTALKTRADEKIASIKAKREQLQRMEQALADIRDCACSDNIQCLLDTTCCTVD